MRHIIPNRSTILVVDDDAMLRVLLAELFSDEGFTVIEAENGEDALAQLERNHSVAVVVTDFQMPGRVDGLELARRWIARWPHVGVIISSGSIQMRRHDLPASARFIAKPWRPSEMLQLVEQALVRGGIAA